MASLFFWGCPTTPDVNSGDYLRSPITFRVDTIPAKHPFCAEGLSSLPVDSCQSTKKYAFRWEHPEDTTGLLEYRIYLDTTPPNASGKNWTQIRGESALANAIIPASGGFSDSLLFLFNNAGFHQTHLATGERKIVAFDTSGRIDEKGQLVFAMIAIYKDGAVGQPRYTYIVANDHFSPFPLQPRYTPYARSVEIGWNRPLDPTSFFDPGSDSGVIKQYVLRIVRGGILNAIRSGEFAPQIHYENGGADWSDRVVTDSFTTSRNGRGWKFILPDSQHVFNALASDPRDSIRVILSGLTPRDTVDITLWAVDASGNITDTSSSAVNRVILTDTTEPVTPLLRTIPGGGGQNQITYAFTASRDLVELNGGLVPADSPNANIMEYHITRKLISGSSGGVSSKSTVLTINAKNRSDTLFVDTVRYLPPGSVYRILVQAMDSTGHLSQPDSVDDSTFTVSFQGVDSGATCPTGFIPIPAGTFMLGDTASTADIDEKPSGFTPSKKRFMGAYCIETYEHQTTEGSGIFKNRVTWQQASDVCSALSPSDSTHLCTEAEWERACEGNDSPSLKYGFQSENPNDPNTLFSTCNIETGDSNMAMSQALRNPTCLTREGVFDMPGNLSEWVLDAYKSDAYVSVKDTLYPGVPLTAPSDAGTHSVRGGYYLNSHRPSATKLRYARCSNRDFPEQIRPRLLVPGCVDSTKPLVLLTYTGLSPRCISLPDSLQKLKITSMSPARDSTKLLLLIDGITQPVAYTLPFDPTHKARPVNASFIPLSLAAVTFENSETNDVIADTLDATEMTDTSDAALSAIFRREASPPWSVRRENGRYAIRFLYAYSQLHSVPARRQYSNAAIGFRCCSLPRHPALIDTSVTPPDSSASP
jgi:hypothetical protein